MADLLPPTPGVHRPRNVDWKRAAALLYGDWGTSKAYVLGLAFIAAGFSSFPIILAVCALTFLVALNYAEICKYFPDGGGVYSAARSQGRLLAVVGALLLVADLTVTAALSGWSALSYFNIPFLKEHIVLSTVGVLLIMGAINFFGPRHSGTFAVALAVPTMIVVVLLILISAPHLTTAHLEPRHESLEQLWVQFVGVILALSGVEAIANLTGVMKLDRGSTPDHPKVSRTTNKALWPIAIEVVFGTALLGWAMLSINPNETVVLAGRVHTMKEALALRYEDTLRFLGEHYGTITFGPAFGDVLGWIVGIVFFLLLLSAANTAIVAMIGLLYMMARDQEMPPMFARLNSHGVPLVPLAIAVSMPVIVIVTTANFTALAGLYAIGVVGAITVNLGSCCFNRALPVKMHDRVLFGITFTILFFVEITLARTKPDALFFVTCVLLIGLALRAWTQKRSGLTTVTVTRQVAAMVTPDLATALQPRIQEGQKIMVAARGITPVLGFALDEAQLRKAVLCVVYIKEIAVFFGGGPATLGRVKWKDDPEASAIMSSMIKRGEERGVCVLPVYAVSEDPASAILDLSATMGVDYLMIGASQRTALGHLLRGSVVTSVAAQLPEDIRLVIFG
ncbi:MAG: amino acid permease [Verrucomicrobiota bacterium]|nr:amino acid permease [Verrucomicrobiota bacterium]MDQ6938562.1 amino acid permease [Verrucomicrobiota bacterium]